MAIHLGERLLDIGWFRNWNGWGFGVVVDHGVAPQHIEVDATASFTRPRGPARVRIYLGPRILVFSAANPS